MQIKLTFFVVLMYFCTFAALLTHMRSMILWLQNLKLSRP